MTELANGAPSATETKSESFAIIGYALRLPGAANADEFWDVLSEGRDAISEVPADRWDVDEFYDPDPDAPGKIVTRRFGFIDDATGFDAPFFGLSNRETMLIDPQHRLLLETAWRAVEHSGTAPSALAGTRTGVFIGLGTHDYLGLISEQLDYDEIQAYVAIGTSAAAGAGRISYGLGLQGPAVTVDTACSSSLVAVHQACQALRYGECDLALVGGANVLLSAKTAMTFSHAHMLAPDGKCKTFDAAADGYVRGEGVGVVIVKRLEDAIRDGDRVRAVIRGSAVNQDGASGGLTVPNGVAQQRVIADALEHAGVAAGDVGYLKAHGTGTSLGDPIEVQAAAAALGKGRAEDRPLLIGSVKTNIGHLEAAAGIAGLIKVILSLEHEELPKHLHFQKPSPHIPWDRLPVRVVAESTPWARDGRPRIAGISSFGFSGTNSHVIIEEAPVETSQVDVAPAPADDRRFSVLPLSARSPEALVQLADGYRNWLTARPDASLAEVCFTAGVGRSHLEHRAAVVVNSTESAREFLGALADDRPAPGLLRGESNDKPKTAWLFTGQGSQYTGMARELFETEPVFAETMTRCAAAVADALEKPLLDVIFDADNEDTLRQTAYAQPALFAVEMGLATLWRSWGFEPDVLIGHSVGQYTAACVAGVFSLEDGMLLMAERGRLFGSLPAGGRMAAVFAAPERVESLTDEFPSLSVAAYNGANTVLSGPGQDLEQAVAKLSDDGVRCDWLDTSHAFHSVLLDPVLDEFESYADRFEFRAPQKTLVCNRTGAALGRSAKLDGAYWRRHARQPVEFAKSVRTLADLRCTMLLEIGPQPVLTAAAMRAWPDPATAPRAIASLRKNVADHRQITEALANAYIAGHRPDFGALRQGSARKVDLPTYPFQHRQYWFREQRVTDGKPGASSQGDAVRTETVALLEDGRIEELAALLDGADGNTVDLLKQLAAQHNQQRGAQSITDSRYEIRWEKAAGTSKAGEKSAWILISDDATAVQPLADALSAGGHRQRTLALPVSDADEKQLEAALRAAIEEEPTTRILLLAATDADTAPSTQSLLRIQHQILSGTRRLFRAAAAAALRTPIWLITRGAQRVTGADAVSPAQSSLWGFGRAAALEHPRLWGGLADLSAGGTDQWSRLIDHVVAAPAGEDQIALREQAVYVPRLTRRAGQPTATPPELRSDATYLVTGGLGAIGLEVAAYLAAHGARHLVLTSRRAPSEAAQQRIDAIREETGCDVRAITADVANPHDVARVLTTVRAELPALAGIVHAAGEISTTPLQALDDAEVNRVFAGKVWGAWNLSEATADLKLDFFVSTSSIAGVWGAGGQTAYSAANAFLDGLTWRLREQGVPATSVNFGPWVNALNAGMADEAARAELDKRGVRPLSPADALAGMAELLAASAKGVSHGVVARIDWASFLPLYQIAGKRSFFAQLQREVPESAATTGSTGSGNTQLVERLTVAPAQQRKKLVVDYLRDVVAEVTRIDAAEIRDEAGFFDVGMDSLMAVELRRRLERSVGKELPSTLAMDYPRLVDVADFLLGDVLSFAAPSAPALAPAAPVAPMRSDEPIAIVALACRFPGAPDPEAYWEVLSGAVDAIREIPEDRFDVDEYYDPDPEAPGKIYTRYGGYLSEIDGFDPEFFGISPREAVWMDPQQRLMLEIAWEGLERAGYAPAALRGSRTGVFVGVAANEYSQLLHANSVETIEAHFITGNALNVIAGRVAFALGLEGPAMAVDTACSASLVAVHQACQALHSGDCDMALAGGVNVLVSPASIVATSRARMLSADGRCKTFDAAANGYARSEGCGVLVLKRLSDAERDGDQICAVIRSSAVNQDGASSGLTVPNGGAQQRLIATALARAGLVGGDVDYLEAHGTGTSLGDPIEVQAAAAAYGVGRDANRPLLIGSAKTNIGHLESAAGIAGLIKVVLSLQHGMLPQNLHFENPSPNIPWDSLAVRVVDKAIPWQANGRPRRAGTSSFGFSGTNAHVLIEEAPAQSADVAPEPASTDEPVTVLPLSARSPEALASLAQRYADWLQTRPQADITEVAYTAGAGRSHFEHRAALVVNSVHEARELLAGLADNQVGPGAVRGVCGDPPKTAWFFTGQGSQYHGMARELFDTEPVFAETVKRCAEAVEGMQPRPLLEVILEADGATGGETGKTVAHTSFAQPALFAIEMGLARLWQSWGIEPDVVLGHSVGQYAAACLAGVFSLEDGARLMAERGRLFGDLPAGGRMVAVFVDAQRVERAAEEAPRVSVAAYNGPNTVLSGPGADLEPIVAKLSADGVRCTWLDTSHAFHSELLEPALDEFESYANGFEFAVPTLPLVCNRTGAVLTAETPLDAQYWRKHSRQPVQFAESVQTVAKLGCSVLMEIGPAPILTGAAVQSWPESSAAPKTVVCLRKGVDARRQISEALAAVYISGHRPDFAALRHKPRRRFELPTYPFQRRRFWPKNADIRGSEGQGSGISGVSAILGSAKDLASGDTVFTSRFSTKTQPWLVDHVIYGTVVVPGATYAAMALAAAGAPSQVREVFFYEPIILPEKASREVQLTMHPLEDGSGSTFQIHSRPYGEREADWSLNADGKIVTSMDDAPAAQSDESIDASCERLSRMRPQQLFDTFIDMELSWGPTWSTSLKSLWTGDGEAVGDIAIGEELAEQLGTEPIHPVLLDLCTGVAFPAFPEVMAATEEGGPTADLFLPLRYGRVTLRDRMPKRFYCRARWHTGSADSETQVFDLDFIDRDGHHLGGIRDFAVKRAPREALLRGLGGDATRNLYTIGWQAAPPPEDSAKSGDGTWLIAGFDELAAELRGSKVVDRASIDPESWKRLFAQAEDRGAPVSGIVWRSTQRPREEESTAELAARLEGEIDQLLTVVRTLQAQQDTKLTGGLWIVTERAVATESGEPVDPVQAALWGFGRTVITEQPALRCRLVDFDKFDGAVHSLTALLGTPADEPEIAVRQGKYLAPRLLPWSRSGNLAIPRSTDYIVEPTERGAIDNLRLVETHVGRPSAGQVQIRVDAAGLNFRDVLNVLGLYPGDPGRVGGGDLAGIVTEVGAGVTGFEVGQRVFGFMPGGFATRVNVPSEFLSPVPNGVSLVGAATMPAGALTVRLSFDWANVKPGDRVLIHAASGGVGLAAIQIAQQCGATVFATASAHKRAAVRKLGVEYVYDSRSTDFADQILVDTGGAGVDVVLNSLTNEGFIEATVRATAKGGRFAEIAKRDIWTREQMAAARPDIAYEIIALDWCIEHEPERVGRLLDEVAESMARGELKPIAAEVYPVTEAKAAFRRMQQARHIGKIVLQMPKPLQPRSDRSYLITGGVGALGLYTAAHLAQLGAGDIVLSSRRAPDADAQRAIDEITERHRCRIHVFAADIGDEAQAEALLARIRAELPPLAGLAHLAGVLDDALLPQQNLEHFRTTLAPKALGGHYLHRLTKDDDLDFFIVYSSASSVLGSPGQANYATANALLDGLVADRRAQGLPATSVNWGPWAQGGMATSHAARANLSAQGLIPLEPAASLNALDEILGHGTGQATVIKANWQRAAKGGLGASRPALLDAVLPSTVTAARGDSELMRQLHEVPESERGSFLTEYLRYEVQSFLRLAQPPAATSRFLELGTDSLMAVEFSNRLLPQFGGAFTISATAVFDYPTIGSLAEYLAGQMPESEEDSVGAS